MSIETIEIHNETDTTIIVCKDLKTACNRMDDLKRHEQRHCLWTTTRWLVNPRAKETVEVEHPSKRLAGKVCVHGAAYSEKQVWQRVRTLGAPEPIYQTPHYFVD